MNAKIIALSSQKGGVAKTVTTVNLGIGLAREGKRVLLADLDPQGSLTISLGQHQPDTLTTTLATLLKKTIDEIPITPREGILQHDEGVDFIPSNVELSAMDMSLVNVMSRETILRQYLNTLRDQYQYILLDCLPSLGMLTINALAAADSVIIPVQPQYLSLKGLELLLQTIGRVRRNINPALSIEGILLTMVDSRTNNAKESITVLRESYGSQLNIFQSMIPLSVRAAEISAEGKSIFAHDRNGKVAQAYEELVQEVLQNAR